MAQEKSMKKMKITIPVSLFVAIIACMTILNQDREQTIPQNITISFSDITRPAPEATVMQTENIHRKSGLSYVQEYSEKKLYKFDSVEEYADVSSYGPLPEFLSDTGFDGGFDMNDSGELIISYNMKLLFDFFLAAIRTEGIDLCSARIEEYSELTLSPDEAERAKSAWYSYREYRQKLKQLYQEYAESEYSSRDEYNDLIRNTIESRNQLRRETMTEEIVKAFFSEEESYDRNIMAQFSH